MEITVGEVAELVSGEIKTKSDDGLLITGFASLEEAGETQVSFYASDKFEAALKDTSAGVLIVSRALSDAPFPEKAVIILVEEAASAFDAIVAKYGRKPLAFEPGVKSGAHVEETACFEASSVSILPGAVISRRVSLGKGTRIQSGAVIGEDVVIGENCDIGPNVTIREGCILGDRVVIHAGSVIGADGFGYEFEAGRHRKVDQLGIVRIDDDVEIGACTTIDRARFGETVIGEGTKIDNLVQIGHNAIIGKHCVIVAQCGISGSAKLGNYVTLAARVGIAGHIEIADQVTVGGKSGVIASIKEPGGTYFGYPAKPMKETLRNKMHLKRLGSLFERVKELEKKLEALDGSE